MPLLQGLPLYPLCFSETPASDRRAAIAPALKVTLDIVDEVFPIEKANVLRSAEIAQGRKGMSSAVTQNRPMVVT